MILIAIVFYLKINLDKNFTMININSCEQQCISL